MVRTVGLTARRCAALALSASVALSVLAPSFASELDNTSPEPSAPPVAEQGPQFTPGGPPIAARNVTGTWKQDGDRWRYQLTDGSFINRGWIVVDGREYAFDIDGFMRTGWHEEGGERYYLDSSGAKAHGWKQISGTWYYFSHQGQLVTSGWHALGGSWYYLQADGAMRTGWLQDNGNWYYLQPSGAMATGWVQVSGTWYYLHSSGSMATGWQAIGGSWYYLYLSGAMAHDTYVGSYWLNSSGVWTNATASGGASTTMSVSPSGTTCPAGYPVKGNSSGRESIYHVPGGAYYNRTVPERCFSSAAAAQAAGYRPSSR